MERAEFAGGFDAATAATSGELVPGAGNDGKLATFTAWMAEFVAVAGTGVGLAGGENIFKANEPGLAAAISNRSGDGPAIGK